MSRRKTDPKDFDAKVQVKYEGNISLLTSYSSSFELIKCKHSCGYIWSTRPCDLMSPKTTIGCPKCAGQFPSNEYNSRIESKFKNIKVIGGYTRSDKLLEHKCKNCKRSWFITPAAMLRAKHGCSCEYKSFSIKSYTRYLKSLNIKPLEPYVNINFSIKHQCDQGHSWSQTPRNMVRGRGICPTCYPRIKHFPKISITWLEQEARRRRIKIQHAGNLGEYVIPGTKFRADGYNARTKTVFEFYGDCYHGNPNVFPPRAKPHPFVNKTAQRLYKETMARENILKDLGYNVVSIWESDFRSHLQRIGYGQPRKR